MSEARALTNFVGNAVATIVVSRWENQLDLPRASALIGARSAPRETVAVRAGEGGPGAGE
jgi:aerobic C4-dicarboxylate transport protein